MDATYIAQQYMEEIYGLISVNNDGWLDTNEIMLQGKKFTYDATVSDCTECKIFFHPIIQSIGLNSKKWKIIQKN